MGFHDGELAVQDRAGVRAEAARLQGMLGSPELSGGVGRFLAQRTLLMLTARDRDGRLWISPLAGPPGFLDADGTTLRIRAAPGGADPLAGLPVDQPVGLLVIDLATRRRVRVNGTLTTVEVGGAGVGGGLVVTAEQAYGNCPQYIRPRLVLPAAVQAGPLDTAALITQTDTFFLGTAHPSRGLDASHRGGPPGFVELGGGELSWPDFPGNNMFNSLGNIAVDPTTALLFPDFATGQALHMSGEARIDWNASERRVLFTPQWTVVSGPGLRGS